MSVSTVRSDDGLIGDWTPGKRGNTRLLWRIHFAFARSFSPPEGGRIPWSIGQRYTTAWCSGKNCCQQFSGSYRGKRAGCSRRRTHAPRQASQSCMYSAWNTLRSAHQQHALWMSTEEIHWKWCWWTSHIWRWQKSRDNCRGQRGLEG